MQPVVPDGSGQKGDSRSPTPAGGGLAQPSTPPPQSPYAFQRRWPGDNVMTQPRGSPHPMMMQEWPRFQDMPYGQPGFQGKSPMMPAMPQYDMFLPGSMGQEPQRNNEELEGIMKKLFDEFRESLDAKLDRQKELLEVLLVKQKRMADDQKKAEQESRRGSLMFAPVLSLQQAPDSPRQEDNNFSRVPSIVTADGLGGVDELKGDGGSHEPAVYRSSDPRKGSEEMSDDNIPRRGALVAAIEAEANADRAREAFCHAIMLQHGVGADGQPMEGEFSEYKPRARSEGRKFDKTDELWVDGEDGFRQYLRKFSLFIKSTTFDYIMGGFIVANTLFLGIQIDIKARALDSEPDPEDPVLVKVVESLFTYVFTVELFARLIAYHPRFCCSAWNIFDSVVVLSALLEEITKYAAANENSPLGKLSALRVIRALKLLRALRIIRVVRAFRELRIVLMSVLSCVQQLFWTLSLLTVLIYMLCILVLVELTGQANAYGEDAFGLARKRYFSDLPRALMTVYQCTTSGALWEEVLRPLEEVIPWMGVVWMAYVGFVFFAFQNTVTGMCVDQAMKMSQEDMRDMALEEYELREAIQINMKQLFLDADSEGRGYVTRKQFRKILQDDDLLGQLKECDVDVRDITTLYNAVTRNTPLILGDIDAFIEGCFKCKGYASQVDLVALMFKQKCLLRRAGLE
eukprot:TRINITY_DN11935_c0_g3_i1.p1 TRINITY_DN11935_c0_g3~~TRINITY_DN11935_c0_g3_i1.p1  ORF type:complete len:686 (+),score=192.18 TRINITY_DN11935_c0_g3_i1:115-2172(+)